MLYLNRFNQEIGLNVLYPCNQLPSRVQPKHRRALGDFYYQIFGEALAEYNAAQKRAYKRIPDYYELIEKSGKEKLFYEIIVEFGDVHKMLGITTSMKKDCEAVLWRNAECDVMTKILNAHQINRQIVGTYHEHLPLKLSGNSTAILLLDFFKIA